MSLPKIYFKQLELQIVIEELVSKIKIYDVNFQMRRLWECAGKYGVMHLFSRYSWTKRPLKKRVMISVISSPFVLEG